MNYLLYMTLGIALLPWLHIVLLPQYVEVSFLDVGQGDAILIEVPGGRTVLVDGGPDRNILRTLGRELSWNTHAIDLLVVTNPDKDHIGGFVSVFEEYEVQAVLEPGVQKESRVYERFVEYKNKEGVETVIGRQGMRILVGDGAYLDVLFPDREVQDWKANDGSLIAMFVHGNNKVLLTGDAPIGVEHYLLYSRVNVEADILKVGHHGSRTSTSNSFYAAVRPDVTVISSGEGNRYGHPHKEVLETVSKSIVLRTDTLGTIVVRSTENGWVVRNKKTTRGWLFVK